MDDISDILASVTRAHGVGLSAYTQSEELQQQQDLQDLTRAWVAERVAPEILPYPTELMVRVMMRIRDQIETIEDRTARMDAGTSFTLVVMQTELERFKFLIRSFLRARIAKIDTHSHYLLALPRTAPALLSPSELQYLITHTALISHHYTISFLSSFPSNLRRLDDRAGAGGVGMVEGPDLDTAVFVRCLGVLSTWEARRGHDFDDEDEDSEAWNGGKVWDRVEVSCGFTGQVEEADNGRGRRGNEGERVIRMRRGEVWLVRWRGVREAVAKGECELI